MNVRKINNITLSLTGLDLLLGLLAITFVNLIVPSTFASLSSLIFITTVTIYKNYKSLKLSTKTIEDLNIIYNGSSIALSVLDVLVGILTIASLTIGASSAVGIAVVSTFKFANISNKIIQVKKAQSLNRIARLAGASGVFYIIIRGGNKMLKKLFKNIVNGLQYIFITNPLTVLLGFGGLALLITNGATGGEVINYIASLVNDPTAAEALFYGVGGSAVFVAVIKQGLETDAIKQERVNKTANLKANKEYVKKQARIEAKAKAELDAEKKAKAEAEAKQKADAEERAAIEAAKAKLQANG
jgi:hypothetical protein